MLRQHPALTCCASKYFCKILGFRGLCCHDLQPLKHGFSSLQPWDASAEGRECLREEAILGASIDHPHVLSPVAFLQSSNGEEVGMLMLWAQGGTLASLIE